MSTNKLVSTVDNAIEFIASGYNNKITLYHCPGHHNLTGFDVPNEGSYRCDVCAAEPTMDSGMYGCRLCDYDLCQKCYYKNIQTMELNDHDSERKTDTLIETDKEYVKRIHDVLKIQQDNQNSYDVVCAYYATENIHQFMIDYYNYVHNIDANKVYISENCCEIEHCYRLKSRHFIESNTDKDNNSILIRQMLDQLHIIKYHLLDIGHRYILPNAMTNFCFHDICENQQNVIEIRKDLLVKKTKIEQNKDLQHTMHSRFVTKLSSNDDMKNEFVEYQFGFRFYYHDYYKSNNKTTEEIPGSNLYGKGGLTDNGNPGYMYKDWYITPKYKSMKEDVLQNSCVVMTIEQYQFEMQKCVMKLNGWKRFMKRSSKFYVFVYGINEGTCITVNHILSVMIYTNYGQLSYHFSKTFRRICSTESDESVRKRHSEFGNLAKYLRECVDCYGVSMRETKISDPVFYHGVSTKAIFNGFVGYFCAPTSTTTVPEVAIQFADAKGIVIQIENNNSDTFTYFDCRGWSDYSSESEMLFLGGISNVQVIGLLEIETGLSYDKWIRAMRIFERCLMNGAYMLERVLQSDKHRIDLIINALNGEGQCQQVPEYIKKSIENLINRTDNITIDFNTLENEVICQDKYWGTTFGAKMLKYVYIDDDDSIKWMQIQKYFPLLTRIDISNKPLVPGLNKERFVQSIQLNDSVLQSTLSFLQQIHPKRMRIYVYCPSNNETSLRALIKRYKRMYQKSEYELYLHPQFQSMRFINECAVFIIYHKSYWNK
eukprot:212733_1